MHNGRRNSTLNGYSGGFRRIDDVEREARYPKPRAQTLTVAAAAPAPQKILGDQFEMPAEAFLEFFHGRHHARRDVRTRVALNLTHGGGCTLTVDTTCFIDLGGHPRLLGAK